MNNQLKPLIYKTEPCIYDEECKCKQGFNVCIANNCQCFPDEQLLKHVYYKFDISIKNDNKTLCWDHNVYHSQMDFKYYCLNQISWVNVACSENLDCHNIVDQNHFFSICKYGYCYVTSVRNITEFMFRTKKECDLHNFDYCKEKNYIYYPRDEIDHEICYDMCMEEHDVPGLASTYDDTCLCNLVRYEKKPDIIDYGEFRFLQLYFGLKT